MEGLEEERSAEEECGDEVDSSHGMGEVESNGGNDEEDGVFEDASVGSAAAADDGEHGDAGGAVILFAYQGEGPEVGGCPEVDDGEK